jgi:hypothetical protein
MNATQDVNSISIPSKHYRIRKEIVWLFFASALFYGGYFIEDWWSHLDWPPHGGKNKEFVKNLNCDWEKYSLYHKDIPEIKAIGGSGGLDRQIFFQQPQCAAAVYLYSEGTGIRLTQSIYDREKKRRMAVIVTTFDKHEGE